MIIVWRGFGILVLLITFGCLLGTNLLTNKYFGEAFWRQNGWPFAAAMAASAGLCWLLGRRLNKAARKDANPRRPWTHDFFFLRMEWWAYPLAAVALAVVLTGWKPGDSPRAAKAAQQAERLAPVAR
jgi:hypothetical protein